MNTLSVIVPFCNNAHYVSQTLSGVERAFDFLANRDLHRPVLKEIVVVDDGSTDSTVEIIQAFQQNNPHCKLVRHDRPTSPANARNVGVAASSGDILFFLDGDDSFFQNHLYVCYNILQDPDVDFVKTGIGLTDPVHPEWHRRITNSLVINLAVRRRCHDLIGGFPDLHLAERRGGLIEPILDVYHCIEDVYYNRLLTEFCRGVRVPVETVQYHRHPGNSFDRQYVKFQVRPGEYPDGLSVDDQARVRVANVLYDYQVHRVRKKLESITVS